MISTATRNKGSTSVAATANAREEKARKMIVTQLIPYGKTRYKVLTDDGRTLLLYGGELRRCGIAEGVEIDEDLYTGTLLPMLTSRARERLVHILEGSDKSESELRRRLRESWYPPEAIDAAIDWCLERHYIDDERYVRNYIQGRAVTKSRTKLRYDLIARGIDRELIDRYLEDTEIDEQSQVMTELKKRGYRDDMSARDRQRIIAALARKGYSWSTIESCIHADDLIV